MNVPGEPTTGTAVDRHEPVVAAVTFERLLCSFDGEFGAVEVDGELRYEPSDALAVSLVLDTPDGPVRWAMARELLFDGCYEASGNGDVRVAPYVDQDGRSLVLIELTSPDGTAVLATPTKAVAAFCHRAYAEVPPGAESDHLDLDELIVRLLDER